MVSEKCNIVFNLIVWNLQQPEIVSNNEEIFLHCFDTVGWMTGRTSDLLASCTGNPQRFSGRPVTDPAQSGIVCGKNMPVRQKPNATVKVIATRMKKKHSERCKCYGLAVVRPSQKIFAPPRTTFPGVRDGQNLISWRWSLPSPTDPVWWRSMHTISSYHGNRPTNTQTDRTDYNTLCRS